MINQIQQYFILYLPVLATIATCIATIVKIASILKASKNDENKELADTRKELKEAKKQYIALMEIIRETNRNQNELKEDLKTVKKHITRVDEGE